MSTENFNASVDPDDVYSGDTHPAKSDDQPDEEEEIDDEEAYDILPSNGPGLAGDDGEQTVDGNEEEDDDDE